jgi:hypothetical protein
VTRRASRSMLKPSIYGIQDLWWYASWGPHRPALSHRDAILNTLNP